MTNPLFDALFARHAGSERAFLRLPDGTTLSYRSFLARSAQFAHAMTRAGARPGDRIAAQIGKSPDAVAIYAACAQAGLVFLPLNTAYTAAELDYFVRNSSATIFLCDPKDAGLLDSVATPAGVRLMTLGPDGSGTLAEIAALQPEDFPTAIRDEDDLAALLYTSGTTGRSKGAMLSQRNLLSNARVLAEAWRFTEDDTLLHALPIYHTHGLFVAINVVLLTGGSMIFLPKFDADQVVSRLPEATTMMGVPTFYTRLLDHSKFGTDVAGHMRLFTSGSAPLLAETHRAFEARTGQRILERYGMTETNMSTSNPYDGDRRAGTVGLPLPGVDLRIVDDAGAPVEIGEIGTIEVRGDNVFQGYWQMPEKTAEEMRPDGFFITGDLAMQSDDGYVTIVGRGKDLIISGGLNVYPKEIEEVLDDQPGILESAVIGVPHPDFGEAVVAILVPLPGAVPDLPAIEVAVTDRLASFKRPKRLLLTDALPRNTMGKVQKAALRQTHADLFTG